MITLLLALCFFILANIWYVVTGTCWTIKRTLAERIECFGFLEALIEMAIVTVILLIMWACSGIVYFIMR